MQFSELLENYGIFIHIFITISGSFRILGISVPFYESFVRNSINSDSISQNFLACGELKFRQKSEKSVRLKVLVHRWPNKVVGAVRSPLKPSVSLPPYVHAEHGYKYPRMFPRHLGLQKS